MMLKNALKHGYPMLGVAPFGTDKPDAKLQTRAKLPWFMTADVDKWKESVAVVFRTI